MGEKIENYQINNDITIVQVPIKTFLIHSLDLDLK